MTENAKRQHTAAFSYIGLSNSSQISNARRRDFDKECMSATDRRRDLRRREQSYVICKISKP